MIVQENAVQKPYHIFPEQMILSFSIYAGPLFCRANHLHGCLIKCKSGYSIFSPSQENKQSSIECEEVMKEKGIQR